MYNLILKDFKLGVPLIYLIMPFLTGALMFIPGWIYFIVLLYFCWITMPNMFGGFRAQNDLMFTAMMPVTKNDIVKAKVSVIVLLELLHIVIAMIFGMISINLYTNITYYFFEPHMGFWGLCFVMFGIFNICFISIYYKTAYKYGEATLVSIVAAMLFAGIAQWIGIESSYVHDIFYGAGLDRTALQASILIAGILVFIALTVIGYRIASKRFPKVEI
ncbi:ABC-2 family transporter protein [Paenibacillus catalpae]|uniref:ABC-2 family transporter protein n=1 Tax=Paenibacillus catalpae TaxID=1045775 RepID=A0A1I1TQ48_9BACL|nr:ABC-2 transporter permease [Paenibacillus catalpae]SFD57580.1 ABC-2 family transporter protein [Paenibacillus catalpae]